MWLNLLITPQARIVQTVIELRRHLRMRTALLMRHNLLDDLAVVNHTPCSSRPVRFCERVLQPFNAPDGVFVLNVKRIALCSDPLLAVLLVDDVVAGHEEFADFDVVDGCDVQAGQRGDSRIVIANLEAELGEACLEEVNTSLVLCEKVLNQLGVVGDCWLRVQVDGSESRSISWVMP